MTFYWAKSIGLSIPEPGAMLVFDQIEGPGKAVPTRGLGIGLLKGLEKLYQLEG
jgi:hypothetical protein